MRNQVGEDLTANREAWMRERAGRRGATMLAPLLGVLAVLAVAVAAFAIVLRMQEHERLVGKERELALATAKNDEFSQRIEELQRTNAAVEDDLARARRELSEAQQELARALQTQETLTQNVEDREREITRLTKDLEQAKGTQQEIAEQLKTLEQERDSVRQQLADLEQAKGELEMKVSELSDRPTVELDKVVVASDGATSASSAADVGQALLPATGGPRLGEVVVVNREYDFIVMDLGRNHGVSIGQECKISRGDEVLGTVKVEKVYDELSAAAILPNSKKDRIREHDAVTPL